MRLVWVVASLLLLLIGQPASAAPTSGGADDSVSFAAHLPGDAIRQGGLPDLTVTLTNDLSGAAGARGAPWIWRFRIANSADPGTVTASFASGQTVLVDNLPTANMTYGPSVTVVTTGASGSLNCVIDGTTTLVCIADGPISLPAGSHFDVSVTATASVFGFYDNPPPGGICQVDPGSSVAERVEANNVCGNSVFVNQFSDLQVSASHGSGSATVDVPFTWAFTISDSASAGTKVTFSDGQTLLLVTLPTDNIGYSSTVNVVTSGAVDALGVPRCSIDAGSLLVCKADGPLSMTSRTSFDVRVEPTARVRGSYRVPPIFGTCKVDPDNVVGESEENNNLCFDQVFVQDPIPPDLHVSLANNVNGSASVGTPWVWTLGVTNEPPPFSNTARFLGGQVVLTDALPNEHITYNSAIGVTPHGGATGTLACSLDAGSTLTCVANGPVTLPPGAGFDVTVTATATAGGSFFNPRNGGTCRVDPDNVVAERFETDNACSLNVVNVPTPTLPDLRVTKTNSLIGAAVVGTPWTWTLTVRNRGAVLAEFAAGQTILADSLPGPTITYGSPVVGDVFNVIGSQRISCAITANILTCAATGNVTLAPNGQFSVRVSATATAPGTYDNPRAGGSCQVDPNDVVAESDESNNSCANSVTAVIPMPDMQVYKSNDAPFPTVPGTSWTWSLYVYNDGTAPGTFANGQTILVDTLPTANISYGAPTITSTYGIVGTQYIACVVSNAVLTCAASGGPVTFPTGSSFSAAVTATPSAAGSFANPAAGGNCRVDPGNVIAESDENDNDCADTVSVVPPGPDLRVTKTNDVDSATTPGTPWTWTLTVANRGTVAATFANGQSILLDELPTNNLTYGPPRMVNRSGVSGNVSCDRAGATLRCVAASTVTLQPQGSFQVAFDTTASTTGFFFNPLGRCEVDPDHVVVEVSENNNRCSNGVSVRTMVVRPDLKAVLTNNVNGSIGVNTPWVWTLIVSNVGNNAATFYDVSYPPPGGPPDPFAGQRIVTDALPNVNGITYGPPHILTGANVTGADHLQCRIAESVLDCRAVGGTVSIGIGGSFQVSFEARSPYAGVFENPRADGICAADPDGEIAELRSSNNACSNVVTVGGPAAPSDKDRDKPKERRSHATSNEGDTRTEGNVLEVRCDTSSPPQYEVSFPEHVPYLVIATIDGNQQLRLLYDTKTQCNSAQVGDYAEADGEKQTELLFDVHNLTLTK